MMNVKGPVVAVVAILLIVGLVWGHPDRAVLMTSGHGGWHAIAAAKAYGVERPLFTLSGAHISASLFDAAVGGRTRWMPPATARGQAADRSAWSTCATGDRRLRRGRHRQTDPDAGFRRPVTAGPESRTRSAARPAPGSTPGAHGRDGWALPDFRWGSGAFAGRWTSPPIVAGHQAAQTAHDPPRSAR